MKDPGIVVVGSSNTDLTIVSDRLPEPGETVTEGQFYESGGGKGANQAVAASRAGGQVEFVGRVGDDRFGRAAMQKLKEEGIGTDWMTIDPDIPSGVALILVDSKGENLISVAPGANHELTPEHVDVAREMIKSDVEALLVQLEVPLDVVDAALSAAYENGVMTVLDPAPVPDSFPEGLLENVSILTPNRAEAARLAGLDSNCAPVESAEELRNRGADCVAVTLGADGIILSCDCGSYLLPAAGADARDTVGAGDCFTAVLAVARSEGREWKEAAEVAICAASIATETAGAQDAMPIRDDIEKRMNNYDAEPRKL